jgi:ankyrin repeat protein
VAPKADKFRLMKIPGAFLLIGMLAVTGCDAGKARSELRRRGIENSQEALFKRAAQGDDDSVRLLLRAGHSPDAVEKYTGRTPLMYAAEQGHLTVVQTLISGKANVNARIEAKTFRSGLPLPGWESSSVRPAPGWTPLMFAVNKQHLEIVRTLLKAGADVNAQGDRNRSNAWNDATPLLLAAQNGNAEIARLLIEAGADVNASDLAGRTPLMLARNVEILKLLQRAGVNLNARNADGTTALWRAVGLVDERMIRFLIQAGADVNAKDRSGQPVLMAARGNAARILIEAGADVNATDPQGRTTAMRMAQDGRYNGAVRDLYRLGSSLDGISPWQAFQLLQDAVGANDIAAARAAIKAGADVNESRARGGPGVFSGPILLTAAYHGRTEIVRLLIDSGANIQVKNPDNLTALHHAAIMGQDEAVRLLCKAGAEVNAIDKRGNTPLSLALQYKHAGTAEILRRAGAR